MSPGPFWFLLRNSFFLIPETIAIRAPIFVSSRRVFLIPRGSLVFSGIRRRRRLCSVRDRRRGIRRRLIPPARGTSLIPARGLRSGRRTDFPQNKVDRRGHGCRAFWAIPLIQRNARWEDSRQPDPSAVPRVSDPKDLPTQISLGAVGPLAGQRILRTTWPRKMRPTFPDAILAATYFLSNRPAVITASRRHFDPHRPKKDSAGQKMRKKSLPTRSYIKPTTKAPIKNGTSEKET